MVVLKSGTAKQEEIGDCLVQVQQEKATHDDDDDDGDEVERKREERSLPI